MAPFAMEARRNPNGDALCHHGYNRDLNGCGLILISRCQHSRPRRNCSQFSSCIPGRYRSSGRAIGNRAGDGSARRVRVRRGSRQLCGRTGRKGTSRRADRDRTNRGGGDCDDDCCCLPLIACRNGRHSDGYRRYLPAESTVAAGGFDELYVTELVTTAVVESVSVAMATSYRLVPAPRLFPRDGGQHK